jgi:cobyrinic acid a,c-diamide synthase
MKHAFCIAGTHSGVGKTTLTLGVLSALRQRGISVQPFKCGPDYIDPGHHTEATGRVSRNLDTWMMGEGGVASTYQRASADVDISVAEGVMGLFDGASSVTDEGSTAHVCRLLGLPVLLVIDAKAMARSVAALVHGFTHFDPRVRIVGIIANRVGSDRHADILRESLKAAGLPPLLGAIPVHPEWTMEERHLGLVTAHESGDRSDWFTALAAGVESHLDLDAILSLTTLDEQAVASAAPPSTSPQPPVRLGIARDEAFQFYYEDNLDLLRSQGVSLVPFSPLSDSLLPPDLDGLYFGGGYPELHASRLSENESMRTAIAAFAATGAPIYGECGGFMYLCRALTDNAGTAHPMCGLLPLDTQMQGRLRRLGYVEVTPHQRGLFGGCDVPLRGHEFHWSETISPAASCTPLFTAHYKRGGGTELAGACIKNVSASYIHLHFSAAPEAVSAWANALRQHRIRRRSES